MTQDEWNKTAQPWNEYDIFVLSVFEEKRPSRAANHLWCRTSIFVEPPADAREFGHAIKLNPNREVTRKEEQ